MGLAIYLHIHQVDPGTEIDINAANAAVMPSMASLYEETPGFAAPFQMQNGKLQIADNDENEFTEYGDQTQVWSCFGAQEARAFAQHITAGKVVFHLEIEGNPSEWYVCIPGNMTQTTPRF